jgi:DNA-binding CsgD family transcriptional regulator
MNMANYTCSYPGCDQPGVARGYCRKHYMKLYNKAKMPRTTRPQKGHTCSAEGCDRPAYAKGYCSLHYSRLKRTGNVDRLNNANAGEKCKAPDCDKRAHQCGYCSSHYYMKRRYGTLTHKKYSRPLSERNKEIIVLYENGMTYQEIADKYGITRQRVRQIYMRDRDKLPVSEIRKINQQRQGKLA